MGRELSIVVEQRAKKTKDGGTEGEWVYVTSILFVTRHESFFDDLLAAASHIKLGENVSQKGMVTILRELAKSDPTVSDPFNWESDGKRSKRGICYVMADQYVDILCKWVLTSGPQSLDSEELLDLGGQLLMTRAARYKMSGGEMRVIFWIDGEPFVDIPVEVQVSLLS